MDVVKNKEQGSGSLQASTASLTQPPTAQTFTDDQSMTGDSAIDHKEITKEIPTEVAINILQHLHSASTLCTLSLVSHAWRNLTEDFEVWRLLHLQTYGKPNSLRHGHPLHTARNRLSPTTLSFQSLSLCDQAPLNWKQLFKSAFTLDQNWERGIYHITYIDAHIDSVYCLQHDHQKIVSGSRDHTIKIFNTRTQALERTLYGHSASVLCLQYDDRFIVTGSSDTSIIVWDLVSGEVVRTLYGHRAPVLDVRICGNVIYSCSKDFTVRMWCLSTGTLLNTFEGHLAAVNAISIDRNFLASASGDTTIKLWDVRTGQEVREFRGHERGLACVQFTSHLLASGSNDHTIKLWSAHTGECLRTLLGHTDLVRTLAFDLTHARLVSGSYDQSIRVWDLNTGKCMVDIRDAHKSWVFHVALDGGRVVSASQDRSIGVWDFAIGIEAVEELL